MNKDINPMEVHTVVPEWTAGNNYLLGIALDRYARPLQNCVRDMRAVADALLQFRGFAPQYTILLENEAATRQVVVKCLRDLNQALTEHDSLFIYFSGHGASDTLEKEGYWLLHGCDFTNYWDEGLNNQRLISLIRQMQARHVVVLADSCFSGSLFYTHRSEEATPAPETIERFRSRWAITSGRNEVVSDGNAGEHSPFADKLLSYLQRTDHPEGRFSLSELSRFLKNAVPRNSSQSPDGRPLQGVGDDGGEFVFYRTGSGAISPVLPVPEASNAPLVNAVPSPPGPSDRPASVLSAEVIAQVREYVSKAQLDKALKLLVVHRPEAIQTQQMWNAIKRQQRLGVLTAAEWAKQRNEVSLRILGHITHKFWS